VTTGEFLTTAFDALERTLLDEISKYHPTEILIQEGDPYQKAIAALSGKTPEVYYSWAFARKNAEKRLCQHFQVMTLNGFGLEQQPQAVSAAGALLEYLYETQKNMLSHISALRYYHVGRYMLLDHASRRNLELTESIRDKTKKHSLLWVLDKTKTAMGARMLRKWLEQPLLDAAEINERLDAVAELKTEALLREELKELLNTIHDLERILSKVVYATANARDLLSLAQSFQNLPFIRQAVGMLKANRFQEMHTHFDTLEDLYELLSAALVPEPPFSIREGGFIRDGYNEALDRYREAKNNGTGWLAALEARERETTGIKNLKIRYNKVFGYYIEVSNANLSMAPERYIRRQTLANCERFVTEELKEIEEAILGADDSINALEYELFIALRDKVSAAMDRIQYMALMIAGLDALQSLADAADKNNYCRPKVDDSSLIQIQNGRHPVVERILSEAFIPNGTSLNQGDERVDIITGPNMAGKSTYMRQVALITLMAQLGSFVPADEAHIGIADRIFTRVGAADDLATGQSTFMVEMSEVANILRCATRNSLIILDEIGRGTSTFDGLSIAWSVMEYISDTSTLGARTLFATHYHELTELEACVPGVKNYCFPVEERGDDIVFLRKITRGGVKRSFGIQVAKLAGIPYSVISRSQEILSALNRADIAKEAQAAQKGKVIYGPTKKPSNGHKLIINELMDINVENLSAIEAIKLLYHLQEKTKNIDKSETDKPEDNGEEDALK